MAGRLYTASRSVADVATTSTPMDLIEISAPSTAVVIIHSAFIGQYSDAGDAAAEMLRVQINRYATSGSGGTTVTPALHDLGSTAFGGAVEVSNNTLGGTATVLLEETFNIQAGWYYTPTPEERIVVPPSGIIAFTLPADAADALSLSYRVTFEEIGT